MNKKFIALSFMMFASQFNATPTAQAVKATAEVAKKSSSKLATLFAVTASTAAVGVIARMGHNAYKTNFDFEKTNELNLRDIHTMRSHLQTFIDSASTKVIQQAALTKQATQQAITDATKNIDMIKATLFEPYMMMDLTKKQAEQNEQADGVSSTNPDNNFENSNKKS